LATKSDADQQPVSELDKQIEVNIRQTLDEGRQIFRFDTFGDESFWDGHESMFKKMGTNDPKVCTEACIRGQ
jgi:hypothetical protein